MLHLFFPSIGINRGELWSTIIIYVTDQQTPIPVGAKGWQLGLLELLQNPTALRARVLAVARTGE